MIFQLFALGILLFVGPRLLRFARIFRHKKRLAAAVPGDDGLPIFGHMLDFETDPSVMALQLAARMNDMVKQTGGQLMKLWLLHENIYVPTNGEMVKHIVDSTEEITKGEEYNIFVPWLGTGLLISTGDKWRSRRKLLTPTFHFSMLDGYIATMNRHAKICAEVLEDRAGQKVDMYPVVKMCALDIICETTMGKELDSQRQPEQPYVEAIVSLMSLATAISMKFYLWPKFMRYLLGVQQKFDSCVVTAHNFTRTVIEERSEALKRGEVEPNKRAFLDLLLEQKEKQNLSDEDIREQVDTFMFAGHDTTAEALGWAIWCMACNPEMQERAHQEIMQVLGTSSVNKGMGLNMKLWRDDVDRDLTREDMGKLTYLDRCIKEAMRLYPPVPFVSRQLQNDLQCGEHLLPRHGTMFIAPFLIHRNESIYPNASRYDPDNFLPERVAARNAYDFIPFSAGPRNCIGQKFAQYEEKIIMTWLLRRFRFESDEPLASQKLSTETTLRPINGIKVTVHRR